MNEQMKKITMAPRSGGDGNNCNIGGTVFRWSYSERKKGGAEGGKICAES